jgi:hypothetical protein
MWPKLIILSTPILHLFVGIRKGQEPVLVQTFGAEAAIEGEEGKAIDPVNRLPRRKMNALSVGLPGREKSKVTPLA